MLLFQTTILQQRELLISNSTKLLQIISWEQEIEIQLSTSDSPNGGSKNNQRKDFELWGRDILTKPYQVPVVLQHDISV